MFFALFPFDVKPYNCYLSRVFALQPEICYICVYNCITWRIENTEIARASLDLDCVHYFKQMNTSTRGEVYVFFLEKGRHTKSISGFFNGWTSKRKRVKPPEPLKQTYFSSTEIMDEKKLEKNKNLWEIGGGGGRGWYQSTFLCVLLRICGSWTESLGFRH